jgi:hypothetical protein
LFPPEHGEIANGQHEHPRDEDRWRDLPRERDTGGGVEPDDRIPHAEDDDSDSDTPRPSRGVHLWVSPYHSYACSIIDRSLYQSIA